MAVSNTGHSVDNYYEGKGLVFMGPVGTAFDAASGWRDIGNVPEFSVSPSIEKRDHYSSRSGKRTKDKTWVIEIEMGGTVRMVLEDFNAANLALVLMGAPEAGEGAAAQEYVIPLFSQASLEFAVKFVGTNDIGARVNIHLPKVSFTPTGEVGFISDDQGQIEVEGEILGVDAGGGSYDYGSLTWNPYVA